MTVPPPPPGGIDTAEPGPAALGGLTPESSTDAEHDAHTYAEAAAQALEELAEPDYRKAGDPAPELGELLGRVGLALQAQASAQLAVAARVGQLAATLREAVERLED